MLRKITIKILLVTAAAACFLFAAGFVEFYREIPTTLSKDETRTDAIIVLTGGKNRIAEGIKLLQQGYSGRMLISGVAKETTLEQLLDAQGIRLKGSALNKIAIGKQATSTFSNAWESSEWVHANNVQSIRLVTSNYHMP